MPTNVTHEWKNLIQRREDEADRALDHAGRERDFDRAARREQIRALFLIARTLAMIQEELAYIAESGV